MVIFKVGVVLLLLVLLLRLKCPFSLAVLVVGLVVGISFGLSLAPIGHSAWLTLQQPATLRLLGIIILIIIFSELLKHSGELDKISEGLMDVLGGRNIIVAILPSLVGLLPMPGGALFSAPLVGGVTQNTQLLNNDQKTLANYWFRHIWEYTWPLYPGLILTAELFDISLARLCLVQLGLTFIALAVGILFILPHPLQRTLTIPRQAPAPKRVGPFRLIYRFLPIIIIIVPFLAFNLALTWCLLIALGWVILIALVNRKLNPAKIFKVSLGQGSLYQISGMVLSILIFSNILKASSLSGELISFLAIDPAAGGLTVSHIVAIVFLPFVIGLLSGLIIAVVGTVFPLILTIIPFAGTQVLPFAVLGYASGLAGVMLSPVHLCLVLTNKYFGSDIKQVYKQLIKIVLVVWVLAVGVAWLIFKLA